MLRAVILMCFVYAFAASAEFIPATPAHQPIVPGEWHLGLDKALQMAQQTGIPVIGFWSNTDCARCAEVAHRAVNTPAFTAWRQERGLLMVTGEGKTGAGGQLYEWTKQAANSDGNTSYPFIRVYWVQKDGTFRADSRFSGYPYREGPQTLIDKIESFVEDFSYCGRAEFAFSTQPEMEPVTPVVPLPLVRLYGQDGTLTNTIVFTRTLEGGGSTNWTDTLVWADGETAQNLMVANQGHYIGGMITLTLQGEGEVDRTVTVNMVAEQPASSLNPRFIGEPFGFGEWTMDFTAATNRAAAEEGEAYTLVLFTGALWCPYCLGFEHDVFITDSFKTFVQTNRIFLVAIDNFRRDTSPPSLLRYAAYQGSANDTRNGNSGAGYLSRHGIPVEVAEAVLVRNLALQAEWTLPGSPRIGYPTLILLRKDGTIAGRFSGVYRMTDNTVTPAIQSFDLAVNMSRLHELLDLARDLRENGEEANGYPALTEDILGARDSREATLRAIDRKDVYALNTAPGMLHQVAVAGPEAATVEVALLDANGLPLQTQSGNLTDGISVSAEVLGTGGTPYIAVTAAGATFAASNAASTVRAYTVTTDFSLTAVEAERTLGVAEFAVDGIFEVSLAVLSNTVYRLVAEGAELTFPQAGMAALGGTLYRAVADENVTVRLTGDLSATTLAWQVWNPGAVGFSPAVMTVSEAATNVTVVVNRLGGSSGLCTVMVMLDAAATTATAGEDFIDVFGAGLEISWGDGEMGPKRIEVPLLPDGGYEGDEMVVLTLAVVEGYALPAAAAAVCRLTIIDDDPPMIGRLGFSTAEPFFTTLSPLTVVAVEGSQVTLGIERVGGASTAVGAALAVTVGTVAPAQLAWTHNDRETVKSAVVTLPTLAEAPKGVVTVTLAPEAPIQGIRSQTSVAIQLIAGDAPCFAQQEVSLAAWTRVALEQAVPIEQLTSGRVSLSSLSGALPSGVSVKADAAAGLLRITGVPKKPGQYSAIFQVSENRNGRQVKGGVVRVTFAVTDMAVLNATAALGFKKTEGAVIDTVGNHRVAGTLQLALSRSGRLTARYRHKGGAVSFSVKNWAACDDTGTVTALLESNAYRIVVVMDAFGNLEVQVFDPAFAQPLEARMTLATWSAIEMAAFVGYYTVSLTPEMTFGILAPSGHSYMTLSVKPSAARNGTIKYTGRLADGTAYSGSCALQPLEDGNAFLPVFTVKQRRTLGLLLTLRAGAADDYYGNPSAIFACGEAEPFWRYDDRNTAEASFDIALEICGGYYSSADSLMLYFDEYEGIGPMCVIADGEVPVSAYYGMATALPFEELDLTDTAMRLMPGQLDPTGLRLSFNRRTGVFKGSFKIPFASATGMRRVSAKYEGVLLPGWTPENCQGCGEYELDLPPKPFGIGAYWFKDHIPVDSGGRVRRVPVVQGYPLIIGRAAAAE